MATRCTGVTKMYLLMTIWMVFPTGAAIFTGDIGARDRGGYHDSSGTVVSRQGRPRLFGLPFGIRSEVADEMRLLREWLDFYPINYIIGLTFVHIGLFLYYVKVKAGKSGTLRSLHVFVQERTSTLLFASTAISHPWSTCMPQRLSGGAKGGEADLAATLPG